jgi:hypothetical protein
MKETEPNQTMSHAEKLGLIAVTSIATFGAGVEAGTAYKWADHGIGAAFTPGLAAVVLTGAASFLWHTLFHPATLNSEQR